MIWIWVSWIFTLCRLFGWRARPQKSSTWSSKPNRGSKVSWWEVLVLGCLSGLRFFRFLSGNSYGKPWYTLQKPHPILCNVNQSSINPEHLFFFWACLHFRMYQTDAPLSIKSFWDARTHKSSVLDCECSWFRLENPEQLRLFLRPRSWQCTKPNVHERPRNWGRALSRP